MSECHECSCMFHPPCLACENCNHPYETDCDLDCQECQIDHDLEDQTMTDNTFTYTALTQAAALAEVTPGQARTILESAGVKVQSKNPSPPTEPGSVIIATEVRRVRGKWGMFLDGNGDWVSSESISGYGLYHHPDLITTWTPARVVPEGELIYLGDVRKGDRVRLVLDNGDEATFTVARAGSDFLMSECNYFPADIIRTIHLLYREEA